MYKPKLVVCAGAGISAESGIPTFRNADGKGLWENHNLRVVCDMTTFYDNYIASNDFYIERVEKFTGAQPNLAHKKIAEMQSDFDVICITSNVDTLFEQAGVAPDRVMHIHGRLDEVVTNYGTKEHKINKISSSDDYRKLFADNKNYPVKPNVVFFGENAPLYQSMYNTFQDMNNNDLMLVIGSSEQVVDFCYEARFSGYTGRIFFVNTDRELCDKKVSLHNVLPFYGTAVDFFQRTNRDGIGLYFFPTGEE